MTNTVVKVHLNRNTGIYACMCIKITCTLNTYNARAKK